MTKPASDRDAALERLLVRTLEARAEDGTGECTPACVDAEMAAAWADGTLSALEREAIETHAADCGRCQALLAAMVTTAPPAAASRSVWRMPALGWLIPAATAAAAVVAWFVIPGRPTELREPIAARAPEASVAVAPEATPSSKPKEAAQRDQLAAPNAAKTTPRSPGGARETDQARQSRASEDRKKEDTADSNGRLAALAKPAPQPTNRVEPNVAAPAPATPASAGAPPAARSASGGAAGGIVDGRAAAMDAAQGSSAKALPQAGSSRPNAMFESILPAVIVSPDPASRWRLLSNGGVERSVDGGSTWEVQPTASTVTLSAGASPSASVCWLVGRAGTVLLSTDGRSWKRLPFPETVDLASITAIDGKTATVTASDGRRFTTSDAGATWLRGP